MRGPSLLRDLKDAFRRHNLGDVAAMLTYYAVLAVFPMLVFVLTVGLLVVPEQTIGEGLGMMTRTMPHQAAQIVYNHVHNLRGAAGGGIAVLSALLALWAASRGTVALGRALNVVHETEETRPWWKVQLLAIGMTALIAVLLVVALGLLAAGPAVGSYVAGKVGLGSAFNVAWALGRWLLAAVLVMAIWSILYHVLPNTQRGYGVFSRGSTAGVAVWIGASLLFALYVGNFGKYEKTYGALGAVIIFLIWMWISNLALLLGAEINRILAGERPARAPVSRQYPVHREPEPSLR